LGLDEALEDVWMVELRVATRRGRRWSRSGSEVVAVPIVLVEAAGEDERAHGATPGAAERFSVLVDDGTRRKRRSAMRARRGSREHARRVLALRVRRGRADGHRHRAPFAWQGGSTVRGAVVRDAADGDVPSRSGCSADTAVAARLPRPITVAMPSTTSNAELVNETCPRRRSAILPTTRPTPSSAGTVPSQKTPITSVPPRTLPVPAATAANAYRKPQGSRVVLAPRASARGA